MYKSLDVLNSGGGVVPNSVVYKYSDPLRGEIFRKIIQVLPQPALEVHSVLVNRPQLGIEKFG